MSYESPWMNDELRMFRKTVRRFIQEEFLPNQTRWRHQHHPDPEAWIQAGAAGLLLTDVPEEYGGGGGTIADEAIIAEELAKAGVHFASLNQSIVAHYILTYGSEEQKQNWLPRMARGELVAAIAMTEAGAGSDVQAIKTTATREGSNYFINGSKTFVTNGLHASIIFLDKCIEEFIAGRLDAVTSAMAKYWQMIASATSSMNAFNCTPDTAT